MELMTTIEIAEVCNVSARRVALLCSQGRVEGAIKKGKTWLNPSDAKKPEDPRKNMRLNRLFQNSQKAPDIMLASQSREKKQQHQRLICLRLL